MLFPGFQKHPMGCDPRSTPWDVIPLARVPSKILIPLPERDFKTLFRIPSGKRPMNAFPAKIIISAAFFPKSVESLQAFPAISAEEGPPPTIPIRMGLSERSASIRSCASLSLSMGFTE